MKKSILNVIFISKYDFLCLRLNAGKKSLSNQESAILLGRYLFLELATSTWAQNETFFFKKGNNEHLMLSA